MYDSVHSTNLVRHLTNPGRTLKYVVTLSTHVNTLWCSAKINLGQYYNEFTYRSGHPTTESQEYEVGEEIVDAEFLPGEESVLEAIRANRMWVEGLAPFRSDFGVEEKTNATSTQIHDAPRGMFGLVRLVLLFSVLIVCRGSVVRVSRQLRLKCGTDQELVLCKFRYSGVCQSITGDDSALPPARSS